MDKLRINTFGQTEAHFAAQKLGYYASENLEVEHTETRSSKAQMQELIDGVWHFVHTNADNVFWWDEDNGADLVIVMATPGRPNQDFVVQPEITIYEDLRGKPLAVDAAESGFVTPLRALLREAGLADEGRDFTLVEVGAGQERVDALHDRRAYGAMLGGAQSKGLVAEGFRVLDSINRLFTNYAGTITTRRDWAAQNEGLVTRYLRAHLQGTIAPEGGRPKSDGIPQFGWAGLEEQLKVRQSVGLLRGDPDPRRFADDTYYRRAAESLTEE